MKKNIKFTLFIIIAIFVLYLTKINYGDFSKEKSLKACIIAQIKKDKNISAENAKKFCAEEISKKIK